MFLKERDWGKAPTNHLKPSDSLNEQEMVQRPKVRGQNQERGGAGGLRRHLHSAWPLPPSRRSATAPFRPAVHHPPRPSGPPSHKAFRPFLLTALTAKEPYFLGNP